MGFCLEVTIPLHVTAVWLPVRAPKPEQSGSLGAGLLLHPPFRARVMVGGAGTSLTLETPEGAMDATRATVVRELERLLGGLTVSLEAWSPVPLAVGYAVSAALALAVAAGEAVLRGGSLEEAAVKAHTAEVLAGTGLGDVAVMMQARMMEVRRAPGPPGVARVESYYVDTHTIHTLELGYMTTWEMHATLGGKLYEKAAPHLVRILEKPNLDTLLQEARQFSIETGMAPPQLREQLDRLVAQGLARGWYVKKKVAVIIPEKDKVEDLEHNLKQIADKNHYKLHQHTPAPTPLTIQPCKQP